MLSKMKLVVAVMGVVLAGFPFTAKTQEQEEEGLFELEEMTVTATRVERLLDLTPKSVTIIDRETIESRIAISTLDLLDEVPGISVARDGPLGGQISFRGFNSNDKRSPLFIDGDRFSGRNTLEYLFIDPSCIERIEIIRGPAAAMYGTDAMGGLINIITRKVEGDVSQPFKLMPRLKALNYSSVNNLMGSRVELEGLGNGFDMLLGIAGRTADDYESANGTIPNSDLEGWSPDLRLGYTFSQDHRLELLAKYVTVDQGQAGGIYGVPGYPYKVRRVEPITEKMLKLHYECQNQRFDIKHIEASLYVRDLYTHLKNEIRPKSDPSSGMIKADAYVKGPLMVGGKLFGVRPWGNSCNLTLGTDFLNTDSDRGSESSIAKYDDKGNFIWIKPKSSSGPGSSQFNSGLFVHNDWDPSEQWTVSAGARADYFLTAAEGTVPGYEGDTETTDYPITGSLGVIYRPTSIVHFTANTSTTYRAPATYELFGMSPGFEPNPDLKPETGVTYEVGPRLRLPGFNANLTAFRSDYKDLIVRKQVDSTICEGTRAVQRQNLGEARIQGVEFDTVWLVNSNWKAFMNAAYLRGTDTKTDTPLSYIAPLNGLIGMRYTPDSKAFYIEATSKWSTKKDRINDSKERETDAYNVLNLYAGFDLKELLSNLPDMELRLAFENILDKAYSNPTTPEDVNYNRSVTNPLLEPGRNISISLVSRF